MRFCKPFFAFTEKDYFYPQSVFLEKSDHILIIRLSAMGDVAMSVPVIRALSQQHPNCKITVLSKPFLKPLFDGIPNVTFYSADVRAKHKGIKGLYELFKELRELNITHVADFHNVLRSKILRSFFTMTQAKIAVIDKGRAEKKALTRKENKVFKQLKTSHQRYADVLGKLGFNIDLKSPKPVLKNQLSDSITNLVGAKKMTWIGIAPFAAFEGKAYPLDLMEKVIKDVAKTSEKVLLFGGGKKEIQLLDQIQKKFENVISIAGKLTFKEELDLISHLDLMLSMDSGNAHLAAMQNVKTITIWGVTHPYAGFAPFNQPAEYTILPDLKKYPAIPCSIYGNKVFEGYEEVMKSIPPETIVKKIKAVLSA